MEKIGLSHKPSSIILHNVLYKFTAIPDFSLAFRYLYAFLSICLRRIVQLDDGYCISFEPLELFCKNVLRLRVIIKTCISAQLLTEFKFYSQHMESTS